jgi:hypothetical protein
VRKLILEFLDALLDIRQRHILLLEAGYHGPLLLFESISNQLAFILHSLNHLLIVRIAIFPVLNQQTLDIFGVSDSHE